MSDRGPSCVTIPPEPWAVAGLALIFDMDGVIIDSNPVHREAWTVYNRQFGIETDDAMLARMYGKRNDDIVRDYFGSHLSIEEVLAHGAAKERVYRDLMAGRVEESLVPGVRDFLRRHKERPVGLASNAEGPNVDFLMAAAGLRQYFRAVVNGDMVANPKPHPEVYLKAAGLLGVTPANCIVFEDSASGVEAARAAGMRAVGLRTTHADMENVELAVDNFLSPELEPWLRAQKPL